VTFVNRAYCEYFQRQPEELLGTSFLTQLPDAERSRMERHIASLNRENPVAAIEVRETAPDGTPRWFHWIDRMVFDEQGNFVEYQGVGRDVTERRQAEERLRLSDLILTNMGEGVCLIRTDGTIVYTNPQFEQLFGYQPGELSGLPISVVNAPTDKKPEETAAEIMQVLNEQGHWHGDIQNIKKDGTLFWCSVHVTAFEHSEYGPVWLAIHEDITERKQAEVVLRHALAREMEVSELRVRFLSMASHDLRTPLAVIQSGIDIVDQYGDRLSALQKRDRFHQMRASVTHMVDLLNDILTIGKIEAGKLEFDPEPLDLVQTCEDILSEVQMSIGSAHKFDFTVTGVCEMQMMDSKLIRHILTNLLSNATKYSPDGSTVTIELGCDDGQIVLRVQDQGIGIPVEDQPRLFEAFHRAQNVGPVHGTGLGLAIVKQAVDLHRGTIVFESGVGVGTTFTVTLPCVSPETVESR
jgi:PAS domain S-box-containing protein